MDGMKKKAVLLSGPPGIGKTSSALIICRELGFEPVEVRQAPWLAWWVVGCTNEAGAHPALCHDSPRACPPGPRTRAQVNASDTRGKSDASALKGVAGKLANSIRELTTNTAVSVNKAGHRNRVRQPAIQRALPPRRWGGRSAVRVSRSPSARACCPPDTARPPNLPAAASAHPSPRPALPDHG